MNRLMQDLAVDRANNPEAALRDQWNAEDEDNEDDGDDGDINIIDRSKFTSIRRRIIIPKCCALQYSWSDWLLYCS
jgi:hypothetical protein